MMMGLRMIQGLVMMRGRETQTPWGTLAIVMMGIGVRVVMKHVRQGGWGTCPIKFRHEGIIIVSK